MLPIIVRSLLISLAGVLLLNAALYCYARSRSREVVSGLALCATLFLIGEKREIEVVVGIEGAAGKRQEPSGIRI